MIFGLGHELPRSAALPEARCVDAGRIFILLVFALVGRAEGATISGQVFGDAGEPIGGSLIQLVQVSLDGCCTDQQQILTDQGTFSFQASPGIYALRIEGSTPYFPLAVRVDARNGNRTGLRVELSREPRRYIPDQPPDAARISMSTPDGKGQTVVRGAAGAVGPEGFVVIVNSDTGDVAFAQAEADGSFEASLFAPGGTALLVRSDPVGDQMRAVAGQAQIVPFGPPFFFPGVSSEANVDFNIGPLAPLPGTWIDVPLPEPGDGRIAFGGGGGASGSGVALTPTWIVQGSMNGNRFAPGETLEVTATISISSAVIAGIEPIEATAFLALEKLAFADGTPALAHNVQVSSLVTPTGFGIMHTMFSNTHLSGTSRFQIPPVAHDRAEAELTLHVHLPPAIPAGHYRGVLSFGFDGYPTDSPSSRPQLLLDSSNREGPNAISLPAVRVGSPDAPRLHWTLLTDELREGTRGALPVEDACCTLTSIVQSPSKHLVIPRIDERTMTPMRYRLEPFAPMISSGDRGMTAPPPAVRFRFPSGRLTVRVERPDGVVDVIGPAPFVQARIGGPLDRHGRVPDPGGLSMHDVCQLSTMDDRFEYVFALEGPHTITLEGEIEDLHGTKWVGHGSYEILVGRSIVLDTAALPGTPYEVGDFISPSVTLVPPLSARIEVRARLHHDDAFVLDRVEHLQAGRFGVPSGDPIRLDRPGEYRIDVTASHRDGDGRWWFGSRSWGGVVATPDTPIITHGKRGIDDLPLDEQQAWFFRSQTSSKLGSGHVHLPFHSGDVTWNQEADAHIPKVTFEDREGSILDRLQIPIDDAARIGEIPIFLAGKDGTDPHFDPAGVELWSYAYRSIQRPAVRIREQIADSTFLPSLYWRFSDQYGQQSGNGRNGDRPNDFKFQFAAVVLRGAPLLQPHYSIYGSLFVLVPDNDPGGGTRTMPPFQGNGGGPSGGPLFTLKGEEIDIFFHPTGVRPGTVLHRGQRASFAGYSAPTLPSKVEIIVTSPSGREYRVDGQANKVGWFYDPGADFRVNEAGVWKAKAKIWFDGVTSAGQVTEPYPTGDVLGSREGEFFFYVVEPSSEPLEVVAASGERRAASQAPTFLRPADGPITFTITPPEELSEATFHYTVTMPGFILEEGTTTSSSLSARRSPLFTYTYDAQTLAQDFPNLDLHDADGFAGVDTITISFLMSGTDATGERKHFARQIVIQGEELQMPEQAPIPPRRRGVRR